MNGRIAGRGFLPTVLFMRFVAFVVEANVFVNWGLGAGFLPGGVVGWVAARKFTPLGMFFCTAE
jgi:hypothetical protein